MAEDSPISYVAICCGPNLGVNDRRCGQVALGKTPQEALKKLREDHIGPCHSGDIASPELVRDYLAPILLGPPQNFDSREIIRGFPALPLI